MGSKTRGEVVPNFGTKDRMMTSAKGRDLRFFWVRKRKERDPN